MTWLQEAIARDRYSQCEGRRFVSRDERCRYAKCPAYYGPETGPAANANPKCAACAGPVVWKDGKGVLHGVARSCTNCHMNGLGLPVCWACCPGPTDDYATDGQSMVSLDIMADGSGFAETRMADDADGTVGPAADGAEAIVDALDGIEDGGRRNRWGSAELYVAERLLAMPGRELQGFRLAVERGDADRASEMSGIPRRTFTAKAEWMRSVVSRMQNLTAAQWDVVRLSMLGKSQVATARLLGGVTKQAVNNIVRALEAKHGGMHREIRGNMGGRGVQAGGVPKSGTSRTEAHTRGLNAKCITSAEGCQEKNIRAKTGKRGKLTKHAKQETKAK